jgi:hypothetical protein
VRLVIVLVIEAPAGVAVGVVAILHNESQLEILILEDVAEDLVDLLWIENIQVTSIAGDLQFEVRTTDIVAKEGFNLVRVAIVPILGAISEVLLAKLVMLDVIPSPQMV